MDSQCLILVVFKRHGVNVNISTATILSLLTLPTDTVSDTLDPKGIWHCGIRA